MRREGARRREREGARAIVLTLWVLAQIYLLVNSPGIHISPILYGIHHLYLLSTVAENQLKDSNFLLLK
jgi:hypothetical protein